METTINNPTFFDYLDDNLNDDKIIVIDEALDEDDISAHIAEGARINFEEEERLKVKEFIQDSIVKIKKTFLTKSLSEFLELGENLEKEMNKNDDPGVFFSSSYPKFQKIKGFNKGIDIDFGCSLNQNHLCLYSKLKKGIDVNLHEVDFLKLISYVEKEISLSDAIEVADNAIKRFKFSPRLHTCKARILIDYGQEDLAFEALDRAEIFGQSFIETDLLRAKAHLSLSEITEAQKIIYDLKYSYHTTDVERSRILYVEALIYEQFDEFNQMYTALNEAVQFDPFNDEALQKLYIAVELAKRHEESILLHTFVLDENPYSHTAWFNLGQAYYQLRNYEEALNAFEFAFISNKNFVPAYKEFADVCFQLNQYEKALNVLLEGVGLFDDDELLLKTGQCYEYFEDTGKAKIYYYRALNLNKMADEVYFHIGLCYFKEMEYASSIHFYNQAIKIDDLREDYLMALAKSYSKMGRFQKALPIFQKATEMGPELSENWVEYATFLMNIDGLDEALEVIEEGECYAYGVDLLYCKAAILFKMNDRKNALDALGEALIENFDLSADFINQLPDYREDKDVKSIIEYYASL